MPQLIEQTKLSITIFEHTHPNCVGVFVFNRSSAHEAFTADALNVNSINIGPGSMQKRLRDTVIPLNNLDPMPGEEDTWGKIQKMCYAEDHDDLKLRGKPKGIRAVLMERKSVWDKLIAKLKACGITNIVGKCAWCSKSQALKDAERRVAKADAMEQEHSADIEETERLEEEIKCTTDDQWCCMHRVLSLQEDF
jgi:hypothetical protein